MQIVLTVKIAQSDKGEVFHPGDVQTIIDAYRKVRDDGTLGQPELVELRFMIEGSNGSEIIGLPEVQDASPVQATGEPIIEP